MGKDINSLISELREGNKVILQKVEQLAEKAQSHGSQNHGSSGFSSLAEEFQGYVEEHIRKEENELLPIVSTFLKKNDLPRAIRDEHSEILNLIDSLIKGSYASSDTEVVREIHSTLTGHISKEEKIIYWLTEVKVKGARRFSRRLP